MSESVQALNAFFAQLARRLVGTHPTAPKSRRPPANL